DNGTRKYIIPLHGKGLWGPLWGYLALDDDFSTIYGAVFDHISETPGLGAEITTLFFSDPFRGKSLYHGDQFVSISVLKQGRSQNNPNAVDGISGGTLTSRGVENMIRESLKPYLPFLKHYE
ncbi:MAG: NADH:ubiquinone reductase (Na(+)-transporting) subunit C, partial [Bacteroidales bacterium]|nr:NADH:ubiquinone reductase (Na(+)-transporting) subunit C [Bacteroidales bacterium]